MGAAPAASTMAHKAKITVVARPARALAATTQGEKVQLSRKVLVRCSKIEQPPWKQPRPGRPPARLPAAAQQRGLRGEEHLELALL